MKKTLWMLGMAVTALTSCTQNEVLEVAESRVIGFETFVGKNTRAAVTIEQAQGNADLAMDNLFQFWVYGWQDADQIFDGTDEKAKVYYNSELHSFTYDNHQMWDLGSTYSFAAYSNGNTPLVSTLNDPPQNTVVNTSSQANVTYERITDNGQVVGSKLTFPDYKVGDYDLLAAIVPTTTLLTSATTVSAVPLNFQHLLSLVNVELHNNTEEEYLLIDDIVFQGLETATCTYSINGDSRSIEWATTGTTDDYTFNGTVLKMDDWDPNNTDHNDATDANVKKKYIGPGQTLTLTYFVIPQNNQTLTNIPLTMQAYKIENDKFIKAANNPVEKKMSLVVDIDGHRSWQPGYVYNYSGNLDGAAHYIHFHVNSVEDWSDKSVAVNPSGSNIYN